jgi:hypothetical protein
MPHHQTRKNKRKTRRCTRCGRRCKGHDGPSGDSCELELITPEKTVPVKSGAASSGKPERPEKSDNEESCVNSESGDNDSLTEGHSSDLDSSSDIDSDGVSTGSDTGNLKKDVKSLSAQLGVLTKSVEKLVVRDLDRTTSAGKKLKFPKSKSDVRVAKIIPGVSTPKTPKTGSKVQDSLSLPTTRTLAKDKQLNKLLESYNAGENDFLSTFTPPSDSLRSSAGEKPKKVLLITDYITRIQGSTSDDEDALMTTSGSNIVFKTKSKGKIDVADVTAGQWITANSRIFDLLSNSLSRRQQAEYHEYTRQFGDLLQCYSESTCMLLDQEHRKHVFATGRAWDEVSAHLERLYLRLKSGSSYDSAGTKVSKKKSNHVCYAFNTRAGCKRGESCKYKHKCSEKGCHESHPKFDHESFRSKQDKSAISL